MKSATQSPGTRFFDPCIPSEQLTETVYEKAQPVFGFYLMLGLSAFIATLGLLANSSVVIVGAMIIAPLMDPIISMTYAIITADRKLLVRSAFTVSTGVAVVISISTITTLVVGFRVGDAEILARGFPNLLDLGIATGSGVAAVFAWTRARIANALPGVAIAVSLVPPLCVAGIGLATGRVDLALQFQHQFIADIESSASLLFLTNLVAILFFGGLTFLVQGYGRFDSARGLVIPLILIAVIAIPLHLSLQPIVLRNAIIHRLSVISVNHPHWEDATIEEIDVLLKDNVIEVTLTVRAQQGAITEVDRQIIQQALNEIFLREIRVRLNLVSYRVLQ